MGSLDGKVAIVTGTSRGVGVGIARELLLAGATVVVVVGLATPSIPAWTRESRVTIFRVSLLFEIGIQK